MTFEFREKFIKFMGWIALIAITVAAVMLVAGWKISFKAPTYCEGVRHIRVGSEQTYWQIAETKFPTSDARYVSDAMLALNGNDPRLYFGDIVKIPKSCKSM